MVAASILWVSSSIRSAVDPVSLQTSQNTVDIASMKTDLAWIKGALEARGFRPIDQATSTLNEQRSTSKTVNMKKSDKKKSVVVSIAIEPRARPLPAKVSRNKPMWHRVSA